MQVVSGQLEGTMFDKKAAKRLEQEEEEKKHTKVPVDESKDNAREAALAARSASRVLQTLSTKASLYLSLYVLPVVPYLIFPEEGRVQHRHKTFTLKISSGD